MQHFVLHLSALDMFYSRIVSEKCKKLFSVDMIESLIHRLELIDILFVLFIFIISRYNSAATYCIRTRITT
jgi:hypothetical protein